MDAGNGFVGVLLRVGQAKIEQDDVKGGSFGVVRRGSFEALDGFLERWRRSYRELLGAAALQSEGSQDLAKRISCKGLIFDQEHP